MSVFINYFCRVATWDKEKHQLALNQFLLPLEIMDFDMNAALEYGIIRADLEQKGTPIGTLDTLIAAHVKLKGLILVDE